MLVAGKSLHKAAEKFFGCHSHLRSRSSTQTQDSLDTLFREAGYAFSNSLIANRPDGGYDYAAIGDAILIVRTWPSEPSVLFVAHTPFEGRHHRENPFNSAVEMLAKFFNASRLQNGGCIGE